MHNPTMLDEALEKTRMVEQVPKEAAADRLLIPRSTDRRSLCIGPWTLTQEAGIRPCLPKAGSGTSLPSSAE
ncbi:unnamed protein product [Heligmosomoides polygyrus]|uniref:Uncharacterized protein n=1 Tax=Heligmosomoides polygyrus TaxID=6339 RepID=A0A183F7U5_HELPZ|nr:unnamed protein product [Heligmosomoides polygyrus]